jgi:hypothetical protein
LNRCQAVRARVLAWKQHYSDLQRTNVLDGCNVAQIAAQLCACQVVFARLSSWPKIEGVNLFES